MLVRFAHGQANATESPADDDQAYSTYQESVLFKDPEAERVAYEQHRQQELIAKAEKLKGSWQGQCVIGVRKFLGLSYNTTSVKGIARNIPIDGREPRIGAVLKTRESKSGHVSVVIKIEEHRLWIYESNYDFNGRAGTRWIAINDPDIAGYIYPD